MMTSEKFRSKYLVVTESLSIKGKKTKRYLLHSADMSSQLGIIKWYGAWRSYCFFSIDDTVFDKGCLRQIAEWCELLTAEYKNK